MDKISCRDCLDTCCEGMKIVLKKKKIGKNPNKAKTGDWFYVSGIILIKKKNGLWRCRAFDVQNKVCRIWQYRPPICRSFFCNWAKSKRRKLPINVAKDKYYLEKERIIMKFSHEYKKLSQDYFTTIRKNTNWYKVGRIYQIETPKQNFKVKVISSYPISKFEINDQLAQSDADMDAEGLIALLEKFYGKTFDDFVLLTLERQ